MNAVTPALADALATTALTPIAGDTDLVALCSEWERTRRAYQTDPEWLDGPRRPETGPMPGWTESLDRNNEITEALVNARPTTIVGAAALARVARTILRDFEGICPNGDGDDRVIQAALDGIGDMVGLTTVVNPDAALLDLTSEFMQVHQDREDKAQGPNAIADDDEFELVNNAACDRMGALFRQMELLPPNTEAGVWALLRCLVAQNGDMGCTFEEPGSVTRRLLRMVLQGCKRVSGAAEALPSPDTALLALRPEFERLTAEYDACSDASVPDDRAHAAYEAFNELCDGIVAMTPALTQDGRKLQAIAMIRQLYYVADWKDGQEPTGSVGMVWNHLAAVVGDAYPIPGSAPAEADDELLAYKPEFDRLRAELSAKLEKSPRRGSKKLERMFCELVAQVVARPPARTAPGRAFRAEVDGLAKTRGIASAADA